MFSFKNNETTEIDDAAVGDDTIFATMRIRPLIAANCTDFVLAHSNAALRPIRQISEIFMMPHILDVMNKLGLNKLLRVQSHTWRHLIVDRSHGAMIVAAPRSGRTLSYILPVCDVVGRIIMDMNENENRRPPPSGPLSVILVPDLERVRRVNALCYAFLRNVKHSWTYTLTLTVPSIIKPEFFHRLFNGVGCLVATPAQLVWVLNQGQLSIKHLKVIVYDDLDLMDPEKLRPAVEGLNKLIRTDTDDDGEPQHPQHPQHQQHPQLVMVSQRYEPHHMATLKLLNRNPALIFGDMLEAAMYGNMRLQIALRTAQDKLNDVLKLLQQRPPQDYRTVIFCSDDADMRRLVGLLEGHLYSCLPYYQDSDLGVGEQVHRWIGDTGGIILLATDNCPELSLRHAHTLIHYSMSSSWGKFKMRHLAISGNLMNKLDRNSSSSSSGELQLHSLVLLDDTNHQQLPRLVDFVGKFQPVDEAIVAVAKQIRKQLAASLEHNQNVVCRQIMMMGDCINSVCEERHHADHQVDCPTGALVPTSGDVKVLLVRVYSPTHFCVHLLEHLPPGSQSWKTFPSLPAEQMRHQLLQGDSSSNERYWPPVAGEVCLYRTNENKMRVRVLKVEPIKNVNLSVTNLDVLVQAMDEDTQILKVKSGRLYVCPEELQAKPPLAIDLRLFGVVPRSGERDWSEEDRRAIQHRVQGLPEKCFLQASIQFATAHTIFIRNLTVISYASSMKMFVRRLGLYQHLTETETGLAKSCEQAKAKILAFFEDAITTATGLETVAVAGGQLKKKMPEEEQQQLKEVTKENDPPNKPAVLKGKALDDVIQMGLERFPFGGNAAKKQQQQREQEAKEEAAKQLEEDQNNNNNSLKLLLECINNVANLTVEDGGLEMPDEERKGMLQGASKLLDHMEHGSQGGQPKKCRKKKTNTKKHDVDFKVTPPRNPDMHLVLPPNVVRPPTTYYQTPTTLELHVLLPDDSFEYSALLTGNQVLFIGHHPSTELRHQFTLTLGVPYSSMRHYMRGRTVYMSVKKTVAMPDPLNFVQYYNFLKPNHDKFGQMDEDPKEQAQKFANYDQRLAFAAPKYEEEEENGGNTDDEDEWMMDGRVERVNKYEKYED